MFIHVLQKSGDTLIRVAAALIKVSRVSHISASVLKTGSRVLLTKAH